ncbi:D-alanyl-D-alanine carboxypeptidase family protein [Microcoleus sp. FACHB-672]|uniref:D-alanyl-D-alanine carboxypeptidase family protein n=1 Tax=Microcoleus sp. FACHB-672 TaxID=2692825 RepID=UPI001F549EFF|nr:D-alanyl-D-alanine carboxypeptidase family protein [Microcoleus sp. FACHB-672]
MKRYIITNFLIRVLVLVLGAGQAALGSPIVLDFSIQEPDIQTPPPTPIQEIEKPQNILQKLSAAQLFATRQSAGSIAIGAAEGNLTAAGKTTTLYLGHIDPGNHVTNRGFCSWNRALNLTVAEADRRCLAALQSQSAAVERKLKDLGIDVKTDIEALVNGADIWNQSKFAGRQFAAKYKKALEKGLRGERAVLDARVEAFRNEVGQLDATGLFGICLREPHYRRQLAGLTAYSEAWRWQCIALDQGRRVGEVSYALKLNLGNIQIASSKIKTVNQPISSKLARQDEPVSTPQVQPISESMVLSFQPALDQGSAPTPIPDSDSIDVSLLVSTSANVEDKNLSDSVQNVVLPASSQPTASEALTLSFDPTASPEVPVVPEKPKVVEIASAKAVNLGAGADKTTVKFDTGSLLARSPKHGDRVGSYSIASHFGIRPQPCAVCSKYHNGVDVGTPIGTPLYAMALPGATAKVQCFNTHLGGLTAIINSQSIPDRSFAAVHLSSCKAGTHKAGEIFARTGNSGAATTGPHLHWGESVNYQYVPPQRGYIEWVISSRIPQQFEPKAIRSTAPKPVLYGHLAYAEAPQNELVNVGNGEKLRQNAAAKFKEMVAAAGKKNIRLIPLSGFRSIQEQRSVFYDTAAARGQSPEERAKVSAPPGYSEHHTGYAIDIGDASHPELNFSPDLENTPAFRWMLANAETYGFELSFPRNNSQGVTYEPWHWRYVGDRQSQEIFKAARVAVK